MLVSCSQLTSTTKLPVFFLKFEKTAHGLRVNETKPDTENACSWNYLGFRVNNKSKCDEMAMFQVALQNLDLYLHGTKHDTENACSLNYLGIRVNNKSKCNEMAIIRVSLQNLSCSLTLRQWIT